MIDKTSKKTIIKIIWSVSVIILIIQFLIEYNWGLELVIFGLGANFIRLILIIYILISPILLFKYKKYKGLKVIYTVLSFLLVIFILFSYGFLLSGKKYFYFKSPFDRRTLVVEETSFLLAGYSNFYESKYGIFIKPLGEGIGTDDGFRPFSINHYTIKWLDQNRVQLDYDFGPMDCWKTEVIYFNK